MTEIKWKPRRKYNPIPRSRTRKVEVELGNSLAFIRVVSLGLLFAIVLIATNYFHLHCCHHRHYFVTDFYFCPTD